MKEELLGAVIYVCVKHIIVLTSTKFFFQNLIQYLTKSYNNVKFTIRKEVFDSIY